MKKIIVFSLFLLAVIAGCSREAPGPTGAYSEVIDKLYKNDPGLNEDIKYIALDTSLIKNISNVQKLSLLKGLEKYGFEVLNMTFEDLNERGFIEDLYFKEGILIKLEDIKISPYEIHIDASKWRSGLGAIGYSNIKVKYKNGAWKITDMGSSWIS